VEESGCGIAVDPSGVTALAQALQRLAARTEESKRMGRAGRDYLTAVCSRQRCVAAIEHVLVASR
jgi:glycosyltransferase involved in cell wall biosynthesis